MGPLVAVCVQCDAERRVINIQTDGYNGEIGAGMDEDEAPRSTWTCDRCGKSEGRLLASFGYQLEPESDELPRLHDFFDAFILTHECLTPRATFQVTMFDCA